MTVGRRRQRRRRPEIVVADNGIGIDPARGRARLRDVRPHSAGAAAEYQGTGLGLAISRRIVERHGGRLWVEPNAGGGSVFSPQAAATVESRSSPLARLRGSPPARPSSPSWSAPPRSCSASSIAFRPERVSDGSGYFHSALRTYLERAFLHLDLGTSQERGLSFQPICSAGAAPPSRPTCRWWPGASTARDGRPGIALGAVAQQRRGTLVARGLDGFAAFAMCAPVYWVGAMTVVFFHPEVGEIARLPICKPNTYRPLTHDPLAWLQSLWLPWIILGLPLAAITMRMMRASLARDLRRGLRAHRARQGPDRPARDAPPRHPRRQRPGHLTRGRDDGDA